MSDQVGSITDVIRSDGQRVAHYDYDAFGNLRPSSSYDSITVNTGGLIRDYPNRYRFQGREYDEHRHDYYFRLRTYVPEWGSFTGPDMQVSPLDPNGFGNYLFAANNPLVYVDPTGLYDETKARDELCRLADDEEMPKSVRNRLKSKSVQVWDPATSKYARPNKPLSVVQHGYQGKTDHTRWTVWVPDTAEGLSDKDAARLALKALIDNARKIAFQENREKLRERKCFMWDPRLSLSMSPEKSPAHLPVAPAIVPEGAALKSPKDEIDRTRGMALLELSSNFVGTPVPACKVDVFVAGAMNIVGGKETGGSPEVGSSVYDKAASLEAHASQTGSLEYHMWYSVETPKPTGRTIDGYFPIYQLQSESRSKLLFTGTHTAVNRRASRAKKDFLNELRERNAGSFWLYPVTKWEAP